MQITENQPKRILGLLLTFSGGHGVNGKDRENTMEYDPNAALSIINSI
jgi:hypothetical protein